jgi:hypothetical protein
VPVTVTAIRTSGDERNGVAAPASAEVGPSYVLTAV